MLLKSLRIGQLITGPSGTVYKVLEVLDTTAVVVSSYPQQHNSGDTKMVLDEAALERFNPFLGDTP